MGGGAGNRHDRSPLTEPAPAKVNLALHVTGRRRDGYHLLDTLVVFTEAGDSVRVATRPRDEFTIHGRFGGGLSANADNLVPRARELFRKMHPEGGQTAVSIVLDKNLPVASGVGGGSSDAAATLRALHRLHGMAADDTKLAEAALALGADLPMCLAARTLRAQGVGEIIEPVRGWPSLDLVLVNPGVAVATPSVFAGLDQRENPPLPELPERPDSAAILSWLESSRNDLEASALSVAPVIGEALGALRSSGAALARMSGSGATCFGLFTSQEAARRAAEKIAAAQPSWYVEATRTIEQDDDAD